MGMNTSTDLTRQMAHFDDSEDSFEILTDATGNVFITEDTLQRLQAQGDVDAGPTASDEAPLDAATGLRDINGWDINPE